jgi:hypothetical protein
MMDQAGGGRIPNVLSARRFLSGLALVAFLAACSGGDVSTPSAPSTASAAAPAAGSGLGQGTVTIRELTPQSDSKLLVDYNCSAGGVTRVCSDTWHGTFDVLVDRPITYAVLTARFFANQILCGYGAMTADLIPAGSRVSLTVKRIYLSDEFATFAQPCGLPATTNRIEVELWSDSSSWTNTLVQSFDHRYTFSDR